MCISCIINYGTPVVGLLGAAKGTQVYLRVKGRRMLDRWHGPDDDPAVQPGEGPDTVDP